MKIIVSVVFAIFMVTSPYLLSAEESTGPSSKETLITQENSDLKRALYEIQRDVQIMNRRLDRLDDKLNRVDRDVKDLRMR